MHLRNHRTNGRGPGFFNINEPILFGAPIIMNPVFFLPFILVPVINAILAWFAVDLGLVEKMVIADPLDHTGPHRRLWATNWAFSPVVCASSAWDLALMYYPSCGP